MKLKLETSHFDKYKTYFLVAISLMVILRWFGGEATRYINPSPSSAQYVMEESKVFC